MKKRNISSTTIRRLRHYNYIRKLRSDVFALSKRDLLAWLASSGRDNHQIAAELNKLNTLTNGGVPWSFRSVGRLVKRLHDLTHPHRGRLGAVYLPYRLRILDIKAMDELYYDRLDQLYVGTTEYFRGGRFAHDPVLDF